MTQRIPENDLKTQPQKRAGAPLAVNEDRANHRSVSDLVWRIEDFRSKSLGGTLGLVGPWGSGKSSLAIAAASQLRIEHGWQTATFEPWAYGDYMSTIDGFFGVLRKQLGTKGLNRSARKILSKFFASIAPFGSIGNAFGIPLRDTFLGVAKIASKKEDFLTMREKANQVFRKAEKPILVIIEDLDRLDAQELMNCFKLIRLLGELENVYYLLCYDEQTIVDVMQKTDIIGLGGISRAYEYLEKIVQIRVEVLDLYGSEQRALWDKELEDAIRSYRIRVDNRDRELLSVMWDETFKYYLDTPRSLNRFSLHLKSAWQSIAGEVNFADFVGLNFLRFFENTIFQKVRASRELLLDGMQGHGSTKRTTTSEREKLMHEWFEEVESLKPRSFESVKKLMGNLFFIAKSDSTFEAYSRFFRSRRVDGVLYFDRYFRNTISDDDIPEKAYKAYIEDVVQGEFCETSLRIKTELNLRNELVWERLESEVLPESHEAVALYEDLRTQYGHLMEVGGIVSTLDARAIRFAFRTFSYRGSEHHLVGWYEKQAEVFGGLAIGTDIYLDAWETKPFGSDAEISNFDQDMQNLARKALTTLIGGPLECADHSVLRVIKILQSTVEPADLRGFLRQIIEDSEEWSVFDVIVGLLEVRVTPTPTGPEFSVGSTRIDRDAIEHYLGLEWVNKKLPLSSSESPSFLTWSDKRPDQSALRSIAIEASRLAIRRSGSAENGAANQ